MIRREQIAFIVGKHSVIVNRPVPFQEDVVEPLSLFIRDTAEIVERPFRAIGKLRNVARMHERAAVGTVGQHFYRLVAGCGVEIAGQYRRQSFRQVGGLLQKQVGTVMARHLPFIVEMGVEEKELLT